MSQVFCIAETGSTHDGDPAQMQRLIEAAKATGADACKFQWTSSPERLCARRNAPEYREAYELIAFPAWWLEQLKKACDEIGIEFMCTTYLPEDIHVIAPLVQRFKIASFEASDRHFVRLHHEFDKPLIVSTGMLDWYGVFQIPRRGGDVLLHCVSAYPAPPNQLGLTAIWKLRECGINVGFSDHTTSTLTGAVAVAAGATVLEKHFRLDATDPKNPDYVVALNPSQFRIYVERARYAATMVGDGHKQLMPCEEPMAKFKVVSP